MIVTEPTRKQLDRAARKAGVPNPEDLPNKDAVEEAIEAPNPALVPSPPPPPSEQTYQVTGTQRTLEHDPGETFTATLDPDQEAALIWGGHIKRVKEAR